MSPACRGSDPRRRQLFGHPEIVGIDFVEVLDDDRTLCVHFFGPVPAVRDDDHPDGLTPANLSIEGGRRIRGLTVLDLTVETSDDPDRDDCLRVRLDRTGDFSSYRVCLVDVPHVDPRYRCAVFRFRIDCPADLDCAAAQQDAAAPPRQPEISYLAKDYASFRRLLLDRLAVTMPDWRERHEADVGIALVELLAYAGDHLSYYQDAVATEAYLDTARQRISVRRHARLVDYRLHEGTNARAWVTVWTDTDTPPTRARDLAFAAGDLDDLAGDGRLLAAEQLQRLPATGYLLFEPVTPDPGGQVVFRAAHSEIELYTWGRQECRLPAGTTDATLRDDDRQLALRPGDVLVLEEVKGLGTGDPADADPTRRHPVRLTTVAEAVDELLDVAVLEVTWAPEDALPFDLPLSTRLPAPDCSVVTGLSVARGNVLLVDHGTTTEEPLGEVGVDETTGDCGCPGSVVEVVERPAEFAPVLAQAPLTFAEPVDHTAAAAAARPRDPRRAEPQLLLRAHDPVAPEGKTAEWRPRPDLLDSGPDDRHFVAEIDDDRHAHLRFGDGELGRRPDARTSFAARYRVGNGTIGNVGRDAICYLVLRSPSWSGVDARPRNPMAATGGVDPEPTTEARLFAPDGFRTELKRAVTADDYAALAAQASAPGSQRVQAAAAELAWTGSWYAAAVAVDQTGTDPAEPALLRAVRRHLHPYRRMGHDLEVGPARAVPIDLAVSVCVRPHVSRATVRAQVLAVLGSGRLPDGRLGLFHPDSLTFGTGIRVSRIVAAVQAVPGVTSVEVTRLRRLQQPDAGELAAGVLPVGALEVARLTGDPNRPEDGRLLVRVGGGR